MKVDGQCHCGALRYEAEVDPELVVLCHCTDCQQLSGTAFRVVAQSRPGSFRLLAGEPKLYVKTAESGRQREQAFCTNCGTQIYSAYAVAEPRAMGLRVGTLRQRDLLTPRAQLWARSAQRWTADFPNIPKQETQPSFSPDGSFRN